MPPSQCAILVCCYALPNAAAAAASLPLLWEHRAAAAAHPQHAPPGQDIWLADKAVKARKPFQPALLSLGDNSESLANRWLHLI